MKEIADSKIMEISVRHHEFSASSELQTVEKAPVFASDKVIFLRKMKLTLDTESLYYLVPAWDSTLTNPQIDQIILIGLLCKCSARQTLPCAHVLCLLILNSKHMLKIL